MFEDVKVHVKLKIAALWTTVMFCYIYNDYFYLYQPGKLQATLNGRMGPMGEVNQGVLLGAALTVAIPAVMIFLSLVLKPGVNRWLNMLLGVAYALISLLTMYGSWIFYIFFAAIEVVLSLLVAWYAWSWPKATAAKDAGRR